MKKLLIFTLGLFLLTACKKEQENTTNSTEVSKDPNAVSLVQETTKLKNDKGELMAVTYFAQGDNIAVKLEQEGKPEEILIAKKINSKGEPVFANEKMMWEGALGAGGKLTDGQGNATQYREIDESK
ncbi:MULTISPECIES: hypothetical protein [unclassified Kaistella]|uniref:hypothetical protein n=1 Tax=unclassified Kaistella TaxID=2762626 RepID=UPI002735DA6C|nr:MULTISPECIES: hypothetical protein [unclassified Kaistella]MDP2452814.1 hypothetical protein [Kaistella sp. SH11-4b]MDP2455723.1 hypothetical protein [Kaistella sp. SH40-3]MDP2458627.1 hypothetical protein [Kaistella sp. SH19-2b]